MDAILSTLAFVGLMAAQFAAVVAAYNFKAADGPERAPACSPRGGDLDAATATPLIALSDAKQKELVVPGASV
jgi:hypothetical protein